MKWFNQPLAESTSNFIFNSGTPTSICKIDSGSNIYDTEITRKLEKLEEHMNTLEDLIEVNNTQINPGQFDTTVDDKRILEIEPKEVEQAKSDEELFEEFKTRRENNK